ncbi:MAG: methyltransferase domain-containing protein [Bacteroidetes bacterium]|nr:methyltransferase domain-containing protein [Bacteroidota bacterium]
MKNRSYEAELLDADNIPQKDLYLNLKELNNINTLLGGHNITLKGIAAFNLKLNKTYHLLDIGCGGGDNLRVIADWGRRKGLQLQLTGVDLKTDCINYAKEHCKAYPEIHFICSDYKDLLNQNTTYDIIFTALFCHHFKEEDLSILFRYKQQHANLGFFINDLHRHPLAYYSIKFLTALFSKSYLVKNDAGLSVKRGFSKTELLQLLKTFTNLEVKWMWAFRWLVIVRNNGS